MKASLVSIMPVCRNHENNHFGVVNFVNKPVFLGNPSAPLSRPVSRKRFRLACSSTRMNFQLFNQGLGFQECFMFISGESNQVQIGLFLKGYAISHNPVVLRKTSGLHLAALCKLDPFWPHRRERKNHPCSLMSGRCPFPSQPFSNTLPHVPTRSRPLRLFRGFEEFRRSVRPFPKRS